MVLSGVFYQKRCYFIRTQDIAKSMKADVTQLKCEDDMVYRT